MTIHFDLSSNLIHLSRGSGFDSGKNLLKSLHCYVNICDSPPRKKNQATYFRTPQNLTGKPVGGGGGLEKVETSLHLRNDYKKVEILCHIEIVGNVYMKRDTVETFPFFLDTFHGDRANTRSIIA